MDELNPTERRIGEYFLSFPHALLRMPIADVASEIGTSQAAIVRFCKRLGFAGYKDIKSKIADELLAAAEPKEDESYSDIKLHDSLNAIVTKIAANHVLSIEETLKLLDISAFEKAVDLLSVANRVDAYGAGASGLVAQDMQQKLVRIGRFSYAFSDVHTQLTAAASLTDKDVMYLISYSGKTRDVMECLTAAKNCGAKVIAVTKVGSNPLAKNADIALQVCSSEISIRSSATSSRITQLTVNDMLFTCIASRHYDANQEILKRSRAFNAKRKL